MDNSENCVKVSDGYFAKIPVLKLPHKFLVLYMYLPYCVNRDNMFHISSLKEKADELELNKESLDDFIGFLIENDIILPVNESEFGEPSMEYLYENMYFVNPKEIWASQDYEVGSVPYKKKHLDWDMYKATYKSVNFMIKPKKPKKLK